MGEYAGRLATIKQGVVVIDVRVLDLTINDTVVDLTDNSSDGWRVLYDGLVLRTVDLSFSGITKDLVMLKDHFSRAGAIDTYTITFPPQADDNTTTGATIEGSFARPELAMGNNYEEASTYSSSLQSSGEITFTDGTTV